MQEVEIYTKAYCGFCRRAKSLLEAKGTQYTEIPVDEQPERREEMIQRAGGRSTVPQIFFGTRHIGGYDELRTLEREGELDEMLEG